MANAFKNALSSSVGTTPTTVYTAPAYTTTTVIGMTVSNTSASNIDVDVAVVDASAGVTAYLVKGATIIPGGALVPVGGEQKVVLETTDYIQVTSSASASADVTLSVLEQA
jgi:hypothetical protein